jgi:hypothetical protein
MPPPALPVVGDGSPPPELEQPARAATVATLALSTARLVRMPMKEPPRVVVAMVLNVATVLRFLSRMPDRQWEIGLQ